MRIVWFGVVSLLVFTTLAFGGTFVNGGFEDGTFGGWTMGGGCFGGGTGCAPALSGPLNPTDFLPGGQYYKAPPYKSGIVTPGADPIVGAALPMVYGGSYGARINDSTTNYHVSVISQKVTNYSGTDIYFAWAAVLEAAHPADEASEFTVKLTDDTDQTQLYFQQFEQCTGCTNTGFLTAPGGWFYHPWTVFNQAVTPGHDYTLTLLASDCDQGGHAGYAYLDGFGAAPPSPDPGVPEPASMMLIGAGLGGLALWSRKRRSAR